MTGEISRQETVTWVCLTLAAGFASLSGTIAITLDGGLIAMAVAIGLPLVVLGGVLAHDVEQNGAVTEVTE